MADKRTPFAPHFSARDQPEVTRPSETVAVERKPPPAAATNVWTRKAGAFGRNPVPAD